MMTEARLDTGGRILTVRVPMTFTTRGGRKLVIAPDGMPSWAKPRARVDNTMIKALGRAFRWRKLLETGVYVTVEEIAEAEKINTSYVSRILRLTLLAPIIMSAIRRTSGVTGGNQKVSVVPLSEVKGCFFHCFDNR